MSKINDVATQDQILFAKHQARCKAQLKRINHKVWSGEGTPDARHAEAVKESETVVKLLTKYEAIKRDEQRTAMREAFVRSAFVLVRMKGLLHEYKQSVVRDEQIIASRLPKADVEVVSMKDRTAIYAATAGLVYGALAPTVRLLLAALDVRRPEIVGDSNANQQLKAAWNNYLRTEAAEHCGVSAYKQAYKVEFTVPLDKSVQKALLHALRVAMPETKSLYIQGGMIKFMVPRRGFRYKLELQMQEWASQAQARIKDEQEQWEATHPEEREHVNMMVSKIKRKEARLLEEDALRAAVMPQYETQERAIHTEFIGIDGITDLVIHLDPKADRMATPTWDAYVNQL